MNKKQENKRTMAITVYNTLLKFDSIVHKIPALVKARQELGTKLAEIDGIEQVQVLQLTSGTKDNTLKDAITYAMTLTKPTISYAKEIKDVTLIKQLEYSAGKIANLRDSKAKGTLNLIRDIVSAQLDNLVDYNITSIKINKLTQLITIYEQLLTALPRV